MLKLRKRGQSTAEYAVVIGLVIAAAVAMQVYVKRSIQGKMRDAIDSNAGDASVTAYVGGGQYEPDLTEYAAPMVTTRDVTERATTTKGGGIVREIQGEDISSKTGTSHTKAAP